MVSTCDATCEKVWPLAMPGPRITHGMRMSLSYTFHLPWGILNCPKRYPLRRWCAEGQARCHHNTATWISQQRSKESRGRADCRPGECVWEGGGGPVLPRLHQGGSIYWSLVKMK
jgi:hypothetical protein